VPVSLDYNECQQVLANSLSPELRAKLQAVKQENQFLLKVKDRLEELDEDAYEEAVESCYGWSPEEVKLLLNGDQLEVSVLWEHVDDRAGNETLESTVRVSGDTVTVDAEPVEKKLDAVVQAVLEATYWGGGG
jgi:hypothetical protein